MDISVYYGMHWVLDESIENFIELLHLTGVSLGTWIIFFICSIVVIPLFALTLYTLTRKLAKKRPLKITYKGVGKAFSFLPLGLLIMDLTVRPQIEKHQYDRYERTLPWKSTLLPHDKVTIHFEKPFKKLPHESELLKKIHSLPINISKKPNIYLFIVESLREDFLTEKTAKNIQNFKQDNIFFKKTFSSANATQISWYSIFHANDPLHWAESKNTWSSGSLPLQLLKKMGYKIHVHSAAQLKYYGLEKVIFGKGHYLADTYHVYPHYYPIQASASDIQAVDTFMQGLDQKGAKEGNVHLFFLESTHFNYNWPESYPVYFRPISEEKTHLRVSNSLKNIKRIQNRYRNSIHFIDSLFGNVLTALKQHGMYDESIIILTGDHGEEFFEEGQLFHASHLSSMQIEPPIYMKLGDNQRAYEKNVKNLITSHIDIFPTILDYLLGKELLGVFDGESIFQEKRRGYIISGRFNGSRAPQEILISNGSIRGVFRLSGQKALEVKKIQGEQGEAIENELSMVQKAFGPAVRAIFNGSS